MPVITDFRIVDDFYIWEALQGINNARTIEQFRIVDNYYLYLKYLVFVAGAVPPATNLLTFRVPLTAAQIQTLNSVPVMAVAAPGAGKAIEAISGSYNFTTNTTPFTSNFVNFFTDGATKAQIHPATSFLSNGVDDFGRYFSHEHLSMVENKALLLKADADSSIIPPLGDGTAIIYGTYRIITL